MRIGAADLIGLILCQSHSVSGHLAYRRVGISGWETISRDYPAALFLGLAYRARPGIDKEKWTKFYEEFLKSIGGEDWADEDVREENAGPENLYSDEFTCITEFEYVIFSLLLSLTL